MWVSKQLFRSVQQLLGRGTGNPKVWRFAVGLFFSLPALARSLLNLTNWRGPITQTTHCRQRTHDAAWSVDWPDRCCLSSALPFTGLMGQAWPHRDPHASGFFSCRCCGWVHASCLSCMWDSLSSVLPCSMHLTVSRLLQTLFLYKRNNDSVAKGKHFF